MVSVNFKTSLAIGRERFIRPFSLVDFLMAEEDSDARFRIIYNDLKFTGLLPYKKKTKLEETKTSAKSYEFRLKGNKEFPKDLQEALLYYNKSIAAAPYPATETDESTELALAFANRSAVYAKMRKNTAALKDIEQALLFQYPDNLKYKLFERRTECYQALGKRDEAVKSCQESIAHLPLATEPPSGKMSTLTSMLKSLTLKTNKRRVQPPPADKMPTPRKSYGQHPSIPDASDALGIRHSDEFGYHAITTRDINAGDILVVEEAFASLLCPEHYYAYCYHCLKRSDAMIPCKRCSLVMFCTVECRGLAWDGYHHIECPMLPLLSQHDIGHVPPLSLRMLLVAVSRYADNSLEKFWLLVKELEATRRNVKPASGFGQTGQPYDVSLGYAGIHFLDRERAFRVEDADGQKNADVFLVSAINAAIVVNCLECHSTFFRRPKVAVSTSARSPSTSELKVFVGWLLMRYHQIIPANSRAVTDFEYHEESEAFAMTDCGVSVHNVTSFLNHSCCHNTHLFPFNGASSMLVANQPIKKGEQLFVSYGNNFSDRNLSERTSMLLAMNTICCCKACLDDWPTAEELVAKSNPTVICSKCRVPLSTNPREAIVRCPRCRMRKKVSHIVRAQNAMAEKLRTVNEKIYRRSCLHKDFVPELSESLTFIFNNFQIPNMMCLLLQHCLYESFRRYNNFSGIWGPEPSDN